MDTFTLAFTFKNDDDLRRAQTCMEQAATVVGADLARWTPVKAKGYWKSTMAVVTTSKMASLAVLEKLMDAKVPYKVSFTEA